MDYIKYIEDHTLRCEAGYRGGGIEIDLSEMLPRLDSPRMTAYQNYLGGGMLASIQSAYDFNIDKLNAKDKVKVEKMTDQLQRYFHNLTNHEDEEWENASFEENQKRPGSYPGL